MASSESAEQDLEGIRLWIARLGWFCSLALALLAFWSSSRSRLDQLLDISLPLQPVFMFNGLANDSLQTYIIAWDITVFIAFALVSLVIFVGKSNRWLAIYASAMLFLLSVALTRPGDALIFLAPEWRIWLLPAMALGTSMVGLFPYGFPEDCRNPRRLIPWESSPAGGPSSGTWPLP